MLARTWLPVNSVALIVVAVLVTAALSPLPVAADATPDTAAIRWEPCYDGTGLGYECATVAVPLDHDRPRGRTIELALVRLPATDPDARIGSLFLNPGGPGSSGVDFAVGSGAFVEPLYGPQVRARYDIIGFDPRGVARSTALRCFDSQDAAARAQSPVPFPLTSTEVRQVARADRLLAQACRRDAGPIARHMSTANVARDLDLLRAAVGDDRLHYLGLRIGTGCSGTLGGRMRAMGSASSSSSS